MFSVNRCSGLDTELLLDRFFRERYHDRQLSVHAAHIRGIVGVDDRVSVRMRDCAAAGFPKMGANISYAFALQVRESFVYPVARDQRRIGVEPALARLTVREGDLEDPEERQERVSGVVEAAALAHQPQGEQRAFARRLQKIREVELL